MIGRTIYKLRANYSNAGEENVIKTKQGVANAVINPFFTTELLVEDRSKDMRSQ